MGKQDLISVIIPIYNMEQYLSQCVDSVLDQTYPNLEILLIDDGSTDSSPSICRDYARQFQKVRVIHQENSGLSGARNTGINNALGEYICFIDSDDYVDSKYLEVLYGNLIEHHADVSMCGFVKFYEGVNQYENTNGITGNTNSVSCRTKAELFAILADACHHEAVFVVVAWNKLYARKIFDQIRFPIGRIHEDEFIIHEILHQNEFIVSTQQSLYYYRQREESITGAQNKASLKHLDVLDAYQNRVIWCKEKEDSSIYKSVVLSYLEIISIQYYYYKDHKMPKKCYHLILKKRMRQAYLKYVCEIPFRKKIRYAIFLISPFLYKKRFW